MAGSNAAASNINTLIFLYFSFAIFFEFTFLRIKFLVVGHKITKYSAKPKRFCRKNIKKHKFF